MSHGGGCRARARYLRIIAQCGITMVTDRHVGHHQANDLFTIDLLLEIIKKRFCVEYSKCFISESKVYDAGEIIV